MAQQRRSGSGKGIPHHPLVEALASDPSKPPENATKLFGFPGPAADEKSTRLWLDTDLTTYVDVPNEAIVHSQTLENDQGTILWVEPGATLSYSSTTSQEVQAEFLGGSIAAGNLGAAGPSQGFTAAFEEGRWPASVGPGCLKPMTASLRRCRTWVDCQTPVVRCPQLFSVDISCPPPNTIFPRCPSHQFGPCFSFDICDVKG